jgi:hypothetical protein
MCLFPLLVPLLPTTLKSNHSHTSRLISLSIRYLYFFSTFLFYAWENISIFTYWFVALTFILRFTLCVSARMYHASQLGKTQDQFISTQKEPHINELPNSKGCKALISSLNVLHNLFIHLSLVMGRHNIAMHRACLKRWRQHQTELSIGFVISMTELTLCNIPLQFWTLTEENSQEE